MRIREPRTTALIFSSGKMVCTGAKRSERPSTITPTPLKSYHLMFVCVCARTVRSSLVWQQGSMPVWCRNWVFPPASWTLRSRTWWRAATCVSPSGWRAWFSHTSSLAGTQTQTDLLSGDTCRTNQLRGVCVCMCVCPVMSPSYFQASSTAW